jgi:hypothetical protein
VTRAARTVARRTPVTDTAHGVHAEAATMCAIAVETSPT